MATDRAAQASERFNRPGRLVCLGRWRQRLHSWRSVWPGCLSWNNTARRQRVPQRRMRGLALEATMTDLTELIGGN
jgi:hypothetical protein